MSTYNRVPFNKVWIIAFVTIMVVVLVFVIVPNIWADITIGNMAAHRLDNIVEEKKAIDYVARQYLDGEYNIMVPDPVIMVKSDYILDEMFLSIWTDNACYYGPKEDYNWGKIEIRPSIYD